MNEAGQKVSPFKPKGRKSKGRTYLEEELPFHPRRPSASLGEGPVHPAVGNPWDRDLDRIALVEDLAVRIHLAVRIAVLLLLEVPSFRVLGIPFALKRSESTRKLYETD